ncbi:ATP-binding cassette domain-containing protein [Paracoccus bogoriensis]|uniref:ATP-binding cassette domain-containing protein n=1 Tax=Paracoccus bogoriensis TaxID=242065 RepID=UPI001CA5C638|nr:ATP-binding cassette domain-containing protein [Paracoccus bogoriensis]MBW7055981.1 ATP-binding cassette domain-containing protein [Paracoccus bogoriensis]
MSLILEHVTITRPDGAKLIRGLTLNVAPGSVTTVMGPSGIGKSTLLDAIAGSLAPGFALSGRITLNGRDLTALPPERRRIGLMFQDALLFPHLSLAGNLAFGLDPRIRGRAARAQAVDEALAEAGLAGLGLRDPATLSGGQRARAALMRTLLAAPEALLLDEPFGKLDMSLRDEIQRFVFDHAAARGVPVLLVSHDPQDAAAAGGPVVALA